jgi:hypothetical protein
MSCGRGPKLKAESNDNGPFAIDLSIAPESRGWVVGNNEEISSIEDQEITLEAWVKSKTDINDNEPDNDTLSGGIFGRFDAGRGVNLYVKNDIPKFAIQRLLPNVATTTPGVTSSEAFIVGAGKPFINDVWTHIAGVLVNKSHAHPTSTSCTTTAMSETPHLDLYVNGEFSNCSSSDSKFADEPGSKEYSVGSGPQIDEVPFVTRFNGVIDEVRFWRTARTQDEINTCKDRELSFEGGGDCQIDHEILELYWRLNAGEGHDSRDFSGNGSNGFVEFFFLPENFIPGKPVENWDGGWVDGAPIIKD